jgi:hypothetical protein
VHYNDLLWVIFKLLVHTTNAVIRHIPVFLCPNFVAMVVFVYACDLWIPQKLD